MGGSVSKILSMLWSKKEIRILILGLVRYLQANLDIHSDIYRTTLERLLFFTDSRYQLVISGLVCSEESLPVSSDWGSRDNHTYHRLQRGVGPI